MDPLTDGYYQVVFRNFFIEKTGLEFQGFFADVMSKCYPGDFIPTRPWGPRGDRKNDGYLRSERTLFQVYAPEALKEEKKALDKIDEDYLGALPHWKAFFDTWVFVHNARPALGLPAPIEQKLLTLDSGNSSIHVRPWGFEELRSRAFAKLRESELAALLGPVPSRADFLNLRVPELRLLIDKIVGQLTPEQPDLRPVPVEKLDANGLSQGVRMLLTTGMMASETVRRFFDRYYDPTLGERVAQAFRREYEALRGKPLLPDVIFAELQMFAGGHAPHSPTRQVAVFALLAFLFEECHIYERPREDQPS